MQTTRFVSYETFNANNIIAMAPENKDNPAGGKYWSIKLKYMYPVGQTFVQGPLYLEGPEMDCPGIFRNDPRDGKGKPSWSLMMPFPFEDEKALAFQKCIEDIYNRVIDLLVETGSVTGLITLKAGKPPAPEVSRQIIEGLVKSPLRYKKDRITKADIVDGPLLMYGTFLDYEPKKDDPNSKGRKTTIKDLDGNEFDWESLLDSKIRAIPCLSIDSVFIGTLRTIKIRLESAVLTTAPQPRGNSLFRQEETANRVRQEKGEEEMQKIREQFAMWNAQRGAVMAQQMEDPLGTGQDTNSSFPVNEGPDPSQLVAALQPHALDLDALGIADSEVSREEFS